MLILGSRLLNTAIMGLQTGTKLAQTKSPIINPSNLRIVAYEVDGPLLSERPSILLVADIRELSDIGMIIDSNDEFIGPDDVVAIKKIYDLHFQLTGMLVIDDKRHKLGKVNNYTLETNSFVIQQLNVHRGFIRSLADTELLIHRSQIIEINNTEIIVKSNAQIVEDKDKVSSKLGYINPFRSNPNPQADTTKS